MFRLALLLAMGFCVLVCRANAEMTLDNAAAPAPSRTGIATGIAEIVVTARKITENVQSVPISITVINGADLAKESIRTIYDIQEQTPSLIFQPAVDDPQSLVFTLRGRSQADVTLSKDPAVGLYVDGAYVPRTLGMAGSLIDLSQIEVLRGPQGSLYGRNTTGGAISINTNDPTHEYFASLDGTVGNYGQRNLIGIANAPLADWLDGRVAVQIGSRDPFGHDYAGDSLDSEKSRYFGGKLRADFGDGVVAVLSGHYARNENDGGILKLVAVVPNSYTALDLAIQNGISTAQANSILQSAVDAGRTHWWDSSGTVPTYSNINRWDVNLSLSGPSVFGSTWRSISSAQVLERAGTVAFPIPEDVLEQFLNSHDRYFSEELQLIGQSPTLNWVAGLYGGLERGQDNATVIAFSNLGIPPSVNNAGIRNSSLAAFGQAGWEFVPGWRLTGGARYSTDTRNALIDSETLNPTLCQIPAPGFESTLLPGAVTQCPRDFKNRYSAPTWLGSIDHHFTPDVMAYAKVATGYRSGGENTGGAVEIETFAAYAPEKNIEYEIGLKADFFEHALRLNIDGYWDDYKGLQVTTNFIAADGQVATAVHSAATARIRGIEADSQLIVAKGLKFSGWFSYTDAHYRQFVDLTADRSREPFAVPPWSGLLEGDYTHPVPLGEFNVHLDWAWRTATVLDGTAGYPSVVTQPFYGLLNGRIGLHIAGPDLDVAVFGTNITNRKYYIQATAHDTRLGFDIAYPGPPATFGLEIIKRWGGH